MIPANLQITETERSRFLEEKIEELEFDRQTTKIFQHFFDQSNDLMCISNLDGYFTKVNKAFSDVLGYSEYELLERPYNDFIHHEDIQKSNVEFQKINNGVVSSVKFVNRFLTKNGNIVYLEWNSSINKQDNVIYATARDITIKREMEEKMLRSEKLLNESQSISKTGSWSFDFSSNQMYWSEEMYKIYQIEQNISGSELNDAFSSYFSDEEREELNFKIQLSIGSGESYSIEHQIALPDGSNKWIKGIGIPIKDYHGRVFKIEGIVQDITDQKETQLIILNNIREKETLIKELHHRVKNNMQIISSLLSLQANLIDDEAVKSIFKDSQQRIKSMASVHDLLYRSNNLSQIDFSEYIKSLLTDLVQSYKLPNQKIRTNIKIEPISFSIEKAIPLGLLVNEIVTNSLKHGLKRVDEGIISFIMQKCDNNKCYIEIADNGKGSQALKTDNKYTLGKMLIENLAEQLNSNLKRNSNGEGTVYTLTC